MCTAVEKTGREFAKRNRYWLTGIDWTWRVKKIELLCIS